jgi:glycine/D-amino acid oxidase-like deaminating enzyme
MSGSEHRFDAVIVGGGFYGASIAVYLARERGLKHILLVEKERALCLRASYNNQARVHNGYHYPRSFTTAFRSRVNLPRFVRDWPGAVTRNFMALYAIARRNSKVNATQFERFCREIGASLRPADSSLRTLFDSRLIEDVFVVEEYAFDANVLAAWAKSALAEAGVDVHCETCATSVGRGTGGRLQVALKESSGEEWLADTRYLFNCSYSGLNRLGGGFAGVHAGLKHEITEMALVRLPPVIRELAITVMDGPFFSVMPFPARELHTLSHVRYTPHLHWQDEPGTDPYQKLKEYPRVSRVDRMLRDASRYLPALAGAEPIDSLYEVKTVLTRSEGDDGRPILFERHVELPGCYSVLGGKIDNIFDVLEKLDAEEFLTDDTLVGGGRG